MLVAGRVYRINARFTDPPKQKYIICVCVSEEYFLFINSEPRRSAPEDQLSLKQEELGALSHDSFIDCSKIFAFPLDVYADEFQDESNSLGDLTNHIRVKLRLVIEASRHLPQNHKDLILADI